MKELIGGLHESNLDAARLEMRTRHGDRLRLVEARRLDHEEASEHLLRFHEGTIRNRELARLTTKHTSLAVGELLTAFDVLRVVVAPFHVALDHGLHFRGGDVGERPGVVAEDEVVGLHGLLHFFVVLITLGRARARGIDREFSLTFEAAEGMFTTLYLREETLMKTFGRQVAITSALIAFGSLAALADTLMLRSGRSYNGELVSVRNGQVEFRTDRGRTERFDVDDVDRIEFGGRGRDNDYGGGRDRDRDNQSEDGRPSGLREREVNVQAADGWTRTNIELRDGQELYFESRGEVRWGPGRKDGPGGEGGSPRNANRPIPNRSAAALIGKIGENGDPFFIGGDKGPIRVRGRGTLFLGINDDYLQDNSGAFRVIVFY